MTHSALPLEPSSGPEQQLLFEEGSELLDLEANARRGVFSGAIIERQRAKVEAICGALAQGIGVTRIAKAFAVSIHTVMGIRDRNPELVAMEERLLSARLGRIQAVGWDRYYEALLSGAIPAAMLPVGLGIAADKKALLDGKPTAIVEHREELSVDAINRLVDALPRVCETDDVHAGGITNNPAGIERLDRDRGGILEVQASGGIERLDRGAGGAIDAQSTGGGHNAA